MNRRQLLTGVPAALALLVCGGKAADKTGDQAAEQAADESDGWFFYAPLTAPRSPRR